MTIKATATLKRNISLFNCFSKISISTPRFSISLFIGVGCD